MAMALKDSGSLLLSHLSCGVPAGSPVQVQHFAVKLSFPTEVFICVWSHGSSQNTQGFFMFVSPPRKAGFSNECQVLGTL